MSYHGTRKEYAESIAKTGYDLSKCQRFLYGIGIYSTPKIEVAERYATKFYDGNRKYKVVVQNRVSSDDMKIVSGKETGVGEYWVQPNDTLIRPYGLCIKQC